MYWELSQKDFVFQKCSLVSVSETSFKEMKQRKKRVCRNSHKLKITLATGSCSEGDFEKRKFLTHLPYFFNLNLNYEKI